MKNIKEIYRSTTGFYFFVRGSERDVFFEVFQPLE